MATKSMMNTFEILSDRLVAEFNVTSAMLQHINLIGHPNIQCHLQHISPKLSQIPVEMSVGFQHSSESMKEKWHQNALRNASYSLQGIYASMYYAPMLNHSLSGIRMHQNGISTQTLFCQSFRICSAQLQLVTIGYAHHFPKISRSIWRSTENSQKFNN